VLLLAHYCAPTPRSPLPLLTGAPLPTHNAHLSLFGFCWV
jgi:hypothetical protein